ncbi:MAG: hypothetical protein MZV70_19040 [Desulfobacterales bacterium]|nr:hypothetical protein [Desulfobacterales bacterium]
MTTIRLKAAGRSVRRRMRPPPGPAPGSGSGSSATARRRPEVHPHRAVAVTRSYRETEGAAARDPPRPDAPAASWPSSR